MNSERKNCFIGGLYEIFKRTNCFNQRMGRYGK